MPPRFDVLSYGTLGIDRILRIPHWPSPDVSTHTFSESIHLGGKAANTAVFLSHWGVSVCVSGTTIGDDDTGRRFFELVGQHPGVYTGYVGQKAGLASMYCCILVRPDGERAIIGVNADQVPPTPPTPEMIGDVRALTLDLYGGSERVDAARLARDAALPVVVGDLRDHAHPVLAHTTTAIASAAELQASAQGISLSDFAASVQHHGVRDVMITHGGHAVYVYSEDHPAMVLRPPLVDVLDTTGAGDAFRAGVTYGVLQGWNALDCAALGVAAGSLSVQKVGGASDPPDLGEVETSADLVCSTATRL